MKSKILRWLLPNNDLNILWATQASQDKRLADLDKQIRQLQDDFQRQEREMLWLAGICNGLLDYLGVDYHTVRVPDLSCIPEQPRMRDEIRIKKVKKSN